MSWLDSLFGGIARVAIAGAQLPAETVINFVSGVTGVDNPVAGTTDLTVAGGGGGGGGGLTPLKVNGPGTLAAAATTEYLVNVTGGNLTLTVAGIVAAGLFTRFKVVCWAGFGSGGTVTVNAPAGGVIWDPAGGTNSSSISMTLQQQSAEWLYDGTNLILV